MTITVTDDIDASLWTFQREASHQATKHVGFLLWMPTGTGKTPTSLAIVNRRFRRGQVNRVMVVVPLSLIEQWVEAIERWLPHARVITDPHAPAGDDELVFFVCHYEWARTDRQLRQLRKKPFDMIVADEIHKMKSRSSKQSRRLWLIGKTAMYRLGLTGSPLEGNELDFWAQVRFLNDEIFGDSYAEFKKEWTRPSGFMGKQETLKKHLHAKFLKRIAAISYHIEKKNAVDLPPVIHQHIRVTMTPKQEKAYRTLERDMVVEIGDVVFATPLVVTQLIRLQQLAGGYISNSEGQVEEVGSGKLAVLKEILIAHPQPIIIFARFTWEIHAIRELVVSLKRTPSVITGQIKEGNKKQFDVMIAQVSVMAGLDDMQHVASTGVFYSKTFSRIHYDQATGRLDRSGQNAKHVTFMHLDAKNTIDDDLANAIQAKGDMTQNVLGFFHRRNQTMAKTAPAKTPAKAAPEKEPAAKPAHAFSIQSLVDETDIEQPKLRVLLRGLKVAKNGGRYGWDKKSEFDAVVKQVIAANKEVKPAGRPAAAKEAPAPAKGKATNAPAAAKVAKKAA
jgi:superfamily II DNA or RNA helicase